MIKNKLVIYLIYASLLMMSGCNKFEGVANPKDLTTSPSSTSAITVDPTITHNIEPSIAPAISPTTVPTLAPKDLSMAVYAKFMKNETKLSFDRFMPKDYFEGDIYKEGSEYTLSEILGIVTAYYYENSANKKIEHIDYCYIDCGKDGVNELVLRFNGMDIYAKGDDSTLVYVIKYIDGKLSLCYFYETWARSDSTLNEYGYYQSGGSNGASNHSSECSLIDKDGYWQPIVCIQYETDINQLTWSDELGQIPEVVEAKRILSVIEIDTIWFDNNENEADSNEVGDKECLYTFYVYDDKWELIEDANLYTNSIYKEVFDEALVPESAGTVPLHF